MTAPIDLICNRCLTLIGHGHLAETDDAVGGWVERWAHECAAVPTDFTHNTRRTQ